MKSMVYKAAYITGRLIGFLFGAVLGAGIRWRLKALCRSTGKDPGLLLEFVHDYFVMDRMEVHRF